MKAPSPQDILAYHSAGEIICDNGADGQAFLSLAQAAERHALSLRGLLAAARRKDAAGVSYFEAWERSLRNAIAAARSFRRASGPVVAGQ